MKKRKEIDTWKSPSQRKKKKADIFDDLLIRFYYLLIILAIIQTLEKNLPA